MVVLCLDVISDIATIVISFLALIVSIISIIYSVKYSKMQMEHNVNSVRPISSIVLNDYEDKIAVIINNDGTGPLIIKKFIAKNMKEEKSSLIELMPHINQPWTTFIETIDCRTISVGKKLVLIEMTPLSFNAKQSVRDALSKITIYLEYEDIYGNKFKDERKLEFFGRHNIK